MHTHEQIAKKNLQTAAAPSTWLHSLAVGSNSTKHMHICESPGHISSQQVQQHCLGNVISIVAGGNLAGFCDDSTPVKGLAP
eukprot:1153418-Pelagomonas_calceolata.AAC.7